MSIASEIQRIKTNISNAYAKAFEKGATFNTRLPNEYQEVEYIESTGTQYIDTGVYTGLNIAIESKIAYTNATQSLGWNGAVYGASEGWIAFGDYNAGKLASYFCTSTRSGVEIDRDNQYHKYYVSNGLQKIDEIKNNITITTIPTSLKLFLFRGNNNYDTSVMAKQKMKYCKIWDSNVLIRDFIPCYRKSDNEAGLYDLVNNIFYENAGTDDFLLGATVTALQNSNNLASTISSIPLDGVAVEPDEKDINFYDYDGTRLYSYTLEEFQDVTELPPLPLHSGLICQEWNWDLQDIKDEGKATDVGATYITDDGKTRIYVEINEDTLNPYIGFNQTVANGVEVDWGDGSPIETSSEYVSSLDTSTTKSWFSHTYANKGKYMITLNPINDNVEFGFRNYENQYTGCYFYKVSTNESYSYNSYIYYMERRYAFCIRKVNIGKCFRSINKRYCFNYCYNLSELTIPNNVNMKTSGIFNDNYALKCLILPKNFSLNTYDLVRGCYNLEKIVLPKSITTLTNNFLYQCKSLRSVTFPKGVIEIKSACFSGCSNLTKIELPQGITDIPLSSFSGCVNLSYIKIPSTVTKVSEQSFYGTGIKKFDFSECTVVPTLTNTNAFGNFNTVGRIVVPDSLYNEWIASTNWSVYADYIVKASEVS